MIKFACNPPAVNADAIINTGLPMLGLAPAVPPIDGFGMEINPNMTDVPARELPSPRLTYKVGQAKVQNGSWNILDVKFHRGVRISSWCVLVIRDGRDTIGGPQDPQFSTLVRGFGTKLDKSGVGVPPGLPRLLPPASLPNPNQDPDRSRALTIIRNIFKDALKSGPKPSFVLVLLENRDNYIYPGIKVRCFNLFIYLHILKSYSPAHR
jgi:eukaryotic translation initiation factor 2C